MAVSHSLLWPARKGAFPPESSPTSHTFTQGERHPAHWDQFPIGTASYCRSVPQSIEFKGYTHPIYFPQEWNPHFHCFFFPEKKNDLWLQKNTLAAPLLLRSQVLTVWRGVWAATSSCCCCWRAGMPHFILLTPIACSCSRCLQQLTYIIFPSIQEKDVFPPRSHLMFCTKKCHSSLCTYSSSCVKKNL